jgi:hypothetical protein
MCRCAGLKEFCISFPKRFVYQNRLGTAETGHVSMEKIQPNSVAGIKLRTFDQVKTDFGHFGEN